MGEIVYKLVINIPKIENNLKNDGGMDKEQ